MHTRKKLHFFASTTLLVLGLSSCGFKIRPVYDGSIDYFEGKRSSSKISSIASESTSFSSYLDSLSSSSGEENSSSSSSTSSASSSSSSNKPNPSSSSYAPTLDIDTHYRIEPVVAENDTLNVYNLDGTIAKTLPRSDESDSSTWYVDYHDVALYYLGYGELPANYVYLDSTNDSTKSESKREAYERFGNKARLYTKDFTRTNGYAASFPAPNEYRYFEIDIGLDSRYASNASWNRGTGRLVVLHKGLKAYGTNTPTIFFTDDHYSSFREFYNYWNFSSTQKGDGGFGPLFNGEGNNAGEYEAPTTITINR